MNRPRLPIDRAIFYAVAARLWQFVAGGLSIVIVSKTLSPAVQGFYYTFSSLLGIQTLFDLGLTGVLIYVASHESPGDEHTDDAPADNPQQQAARARLGELLYRARRWYGLCAAAFAAVALGAGFLLFGRSAVQTVDWQWPWIVAVLVSCLSLWLAPSIAILEGCNRVTAVQRNRFQQAVVGNLAVWGVLLVGGTLWAVVASAVVRVGFEGLLVCVRSGPFLRSLTGHRQSGMARLQWTEEVLPLQWRIGIQGIASYFALGFFVPVIFEYHGAVLSGQMGMTWNAINTIQLAAFAWISTRIPTLGRLLSMGSADCARTMFRRTLLISTAVYLVGILVLIGLLLLLRRLAPEIASRFLPTADIALLATGVGLSHVAIGLGSFVRAHKVDPFLRIGVTTSVLLGCLAWTLGRHFGPAGLAWAQILVIGCASLPVHYGFYRTVRVAGVAGESGAAADPKRPA